MYQNPTASQARPSFIIINDYCYFAGKTVCKDNFGEVWHLCVADGSLTMVWRWIPYDGLEVRLQPLFL